MKFCFVKFGLWRCFKSGNWKSRAKEKEGADEGERRGKRKENNKGKEREDYRRCVIAGKSVSRCSCLRSLVSAKEEGAADTSDSGRQEWVARQKNTRKANRNQQRWARAEGPPSTQPTLGCSPPSEATPLVTWLAATVGDVEVHGKARKLAEEQSITH